MKEIIYLCTVPAWNNHSFGSFNSPVALLVKNNCDRAVRVTVELVPKEPATFGIFRTRRTK